MGPCRISTIHRASLDKSVSVLQSLGAGPGFAAVGLAGFGLESLAKRGFNWVAVQELDLNHHNGDT